MLGVQRLATRARKVKSELFILALGLGALALIPSNLFSMVGLYVSSTLWSPIDMVTHTLASGSVSEEWLTEVAFVGGYLSQAADAIEAEQKFTEAERSAFRTFENEVRSLSVQPKHNPTGAGATVLTADNTFGELATVRERYRETVMAVPGYDRIYGETLWEHMAAEFSDELATIIVGGNEFTPPIQTLLANHAADAAAQRDNHLDVLEAEYESLINANAQFQQPEAVQADLESTRLYQHSFDELLEYYCELRDSIETCQGLLETRQEEIHERNYRSDLRMETTLQEYLYRSLEVSFPILSTTLDYIRELNKLHRTVSHSIARRD